MTGTQLRHLTTGLWANSKVVFRLEDGTHLQLTDVKLRQTGETKIADGMEVYQPTAPPVLLLTLSPQDPKSLSGTQLDKNTIPNPTSTDQPVEQTPQPSSARSQPPAPQSKGLTEREKTRYSSAQLALDRMHGRTDE
jgi:hypothetical protein